MVDRTRNMRQFRRKTRLGIGGAASTMDHQTRKMTS
jgi:hypothetical protein